jgi:superfamily I DNA/RNA helicase
MEVFQLDENIRNSRAIHDSAVRFVSGETGVSIGPDGGEVRYEFAKTDQATRSVVGRLLHQFINEGGMKREDVVILSASSIGRSALAGVEKVGAFTLVRPEDESDGSGVEISSIWRFKGLDRPAVIITDLTAETSDVVRYVGMTRARSVLAMVGTEEGLKRVT